ncbi:uncharacterized protein LOC119613137 [Lucilia sericata]|uniref:uncharacterized protein LOC119613137 n=1 Tax=Lucilia sericata TaxID=13632 RepID=UPI0018A82CE9|nr:uncharacterized protein LOC119613137 [Lucilia sericata]
MKCCCCSGYTFGIILGSINLVFSLLGFILQCLFFNAYKEIADPERRKDAKTDAILTLVVTALTALISGLFIFAIVKRKYKLMLAWLVLCVCNLALSIKLLIFAIIDSTKGKTKGEETAVTIVISLIISAIQFGIYWFSYKLYKEMKQEYGRKPGSASVDY